jgi:hypothetical protein
MNKIATIIEAHPSGPRVDINVSRARPAASPNAKSDMAPPSNATIRKGKAEKSGGKFKTDVDRSQKVVVALSS